VNRRLLPALLLALAMVGAALASPSQAAVPSERQWVSDTYHSLVGSRAWIDTRVAQGGSKLAVNLDIDNTSLATYYDRGHAVAATLRFVRYARSKGVSILFNSGRNVSLRTSTIAELRRAGYPVDGLCLHYSGESLAHSKQRCRASFVRNGFTIIANVGNRSTDFVGGSYERAFRLPSYGERLA
jgi:predicted secreted acid phosphatase